MRRGLVMVGACCAVLATAAVVFGAGRAGGRIDAQAYAWTEDQAAIDSADWEPIPDLALGTGCQGNTRSSAALSLALAEDSPAIDVRVAVSDPLCPNCDADLLHPSFVTVPAGHSPASFTFVGRADGSHGTSFQAQWRLSATSPPSAVATLESGTLHVLWKGLRGTCL